MDPRAEGDVVYGRGEVGFAETHISTVFFSADRAYKLLKPIDTGFLDHRATEARLAAAQREVELNRRIAPDVYLGTADVVEDGEVVDRMIVMRRLPDHRRLTELIGTAELEPCVVAIARRVAVFHASQPPVLDDLGPASADSVLRNWRDNFELMSRFVGTVFDADQFSEVVRLVERFVAGRSRMFEERIAAGMVRDGHGDLTAQDIFCLDDGPRIIDCLAFREDLRIADVLADVAFLAMDLDRMAGPEAATRFVRAYEEFSNERHPAALAHHYVAYRAHVRAKVACLRHEQGDPAAAAEARQLHDLCLRHLRLARVRLVLVGGGPGVGKSSLAEGLSNRLGFMRLATDERRKDVSGVGRAARAGAELNEGIYTATMTDLTYETVLTDARSLLERGQSVVLDASWSDEARRSTARELAAQTQSELVEIECVLDEATARERMERRATAGDDPSDATAEVSPQLMARREQWPAANRLSTAPALGEVIGDAVAMIEAASGTD